ncbi:hypothetical protein HPB47_007103 [Ixodes persulcatus]|uniref:Uncharacterized protein n=1 Tax=Ixodes persulcatus TaxID=34615 RepID=A0AC60P8L1_IXOPE|nr:hypothetical protein HPB47_007103 [Ixodes persulcatus]
MRSPSNPFLFLLQVFVLIALPSSFNHHEQSKAEECQLFSDLTSIYTFNVESGTVFDERRRFVIDMNDSFDIRPQRYQLQWARWHDNDAVTNEPLLVSAAGV